MFIFINLFSRLPNNWVLNYRLVHVSKCQMKFLPIYERF